MKSLLLITHPEVVIDKNKPAEDWPLSNTGLEHVYVLLRELFWLDVDVIYTSPEMKAYTVAKLASVKFRIPFIAKKNLGEINRSSTGFLPFGEYMALVEEFYQNPTRQVRGWESANDATARIWECAQGIAARNAHKTVALVGHGAIFTLLLCKILDRPPSFDLDPGKVRCFAEVDWKQKEILAPWTQY